MSWSVDVAFTKLCQTSFLFNFLWEPLIHRVDTRRQKLIKWVRYTSAESYEKRDILVAVMQTCLDLVRKYAKGMDTKSSVLPRCMYVQGVTNSANAELDFSSY